MSEQLHPIFIYGTLRRGGRAHHLVKDVAFYANGLIPGWLVHVDAYPGLIPCDDQQVVGEIYLVNDGLLHKLDRYEGCLESPPHYLRQSIVVQLENGETTTAQVYIFQLVEPHHERIENGDWIQWLEGKN